MNRILINILKEMYHLQCIMLAVISNDMKVGDARAVNIYTSNIEAFLDELEDR